MPPISRTTPRTATTPSRRSERPAPRRESATTGVGPMTPRRASPRLLDADRVASEVMARQTLVADPYTHYEERVAHRVRELSAKLVTASSAAAAGQGPVPELQRRFPTATIDVAMAASVFEHEAIQYLVNERGSSRPRRFVVSPAGKLIEDREASEAVLGKARAKDGKVSFTPVAIKRRVPVFDSPPFAPGREVELPSRSGVRSGTLVGVGAEGKWTIELTTETGKTTRKTFEPYDVVKFNAHHEFDLRGGTFSEVTLDVTKDAALKKFLDQAIAIARPILASAAPGTPAVVAAQKKAIEALMKHVQANLEYPSTPEYGAGTIPASDPRAVRFNTLQASAEGGFGATIPFGELLSLRAGMCRHRAIAMQACLQVAGIDSRLTSGGAFTAQGVYRGPHAWLETTLADGSRFLTDAQWGDAFVPLKETYAKDVRRKEEHQKTAHLDSSLVY